jgi:hypothetical protein
MYPYSNGIDFNEFVGAMISYVENKPIKHLEKMALLENGALDESGINQILPFRPSLYAHKMSGVAMNFAFDPHMKEKEEKTLSMKTRKKCRPTS